MKRYAGLHRNDAEARTKSLAITNDKGTFSIPDQTNSTENDGTDANGQEIVYTGISTTHKFTKTNKGAKALNVDLGKDLANVTTFFDTVTTPDSLAAK